MHTTHTKPYRQKGSHTILPSQQPINGYILVNPINTNFLDWRGSMAGIYLKYQTSSGEWFEARGGNTGDEDFEDADTRMKSTLTTRLITLSEKAPPLKPQEQQTFDELSAMFQSA